MRQRRAIRMGGLTLVAIALAASCGSDDDQTSSPTTTVQSATTTEVSTTNAPTTTPPPTSSASEEPSDPLALEPGDTIVFEVEVVLEDDPTAVVWAPNCYTLSSDGTFDDPGFPSADAPVLGTWENGWDGSSSSYVAQAETDTGVTLTQTGDVVVDETAGDLTLRAETTVSVNGETIAAVISTGRAVDSCTPVPG